MKGPPDIFILHQPRELFSPGSFDFSPILTQLGRDVGQSQMGVKVGFIAAGDQLFVSLNKPYSLILKPNSLARPRKAIWCSLLPVK